jgi:hypothetical protein
LPIDETDFHILKALECIHDPRAEAIVAERRATETKREQEKRNRIREGLCVSCGGTWVSWTNLQVANPINDAREALAFDRLRDSELCFVM